MGLPQIDFRVPEATRFKSALAGRFRGLGGRFGGLTGRFGGLGGRFSAMPGLSSTGALAWPYKISVVAVMALVACGTLVTFGSAGAETPSSAQAAALPGSDEANPTVEGQVLPPALLNSADLLSSLNLTDYSPGDTDPFSLSDDDEDEDSDDEDSNEDNQSDNVQKLAATTPTASTKPSENPTSSPKTSEPSEQPTTNSPPPEPVEGSSHTAWRQCQERRSNNPLDLCNVRYPANREPDFED